jgi:carbonic anhydrase
MSQREFMIVLAHSENCGMCRAKLLSDSSTLLASRSLTEQERNVLAELKFEDFLTPDALARAAKVGRDELERYSSEPVVRLRHL